MDLHEAEQFNLEGAEDIDRISGLTAEIIQVKDVAANITLRSGDVIEAIDNAWAHQQRNPRHKIQFRFLTTPASGSNRARRSATGSADCASDAAADHRPMRHNGNATRGRLQISC
jgi:hypothetical protein